MAEQATRMIEVEWDGEERLGTTFVAGVEVVALDRSHCCATSPTPSPTPRQHPVVPDRHRTDRVAKMRFEFEFANPATSTR
jgi:hypothetical protein